MTMSNHKDRSAHRLTYGQRIIGILISVLMLGVVGTGSLYLAQSPARNGPDGPAIEERSLLADRDAGANRNGTASGISAGASEAAADSEQVPVASPPNGEQSDPRAAKNPREEDIPGLAITGAVLDDSGQLLPGIRVTARPAAGPTMDPGQSQPGAPQVEVTDTLGGFTFAELEEGEYELAVEETPHYRPVRTRVRAGVANAELMLQRIRSVRVYGTVSDEAGMALENVRIRALGGRRRAQSDPSGVYELLTEPVKARQAPVLEFSREGFQEQRVRVEAVLSAKSDEVLLDVQMEAESEGPKVGVSGQITGPQDELVGGASVWLSSLKSADYLRTSSDKLGNYRFGEVEVGDGYMLGVEPQEEYAAFESNRFTLGPDDLSYDVQLEDQGLSDLSGTVTDLQGAPLAGFTLWLRSMSGRLPLVPIHTDGGGRFRLENIPAGEVKIQSRSEPWLEASGIVLEGGQTRHVDVPMDWGDRWLLGQVVDERGEPVPRARLVLSWTGTFWDVSSGSRREVMSDQQGYFAVSNLGAQAYTLTAQAPGYQSVRIEHRLGQSNGELRIRLSRFGSVSGAGTGGG